MRPGGRGKMDIVLTSLSFSSMTNKELCESTGNSLLVAIINQNTALKVLEATRALVGAASDEMMQE